MRKLFCMIALGAISFGSVFAAVPMPNTKTTMQTDTGKKVDTGKMKKKWKKGKMKMKMKDTTKMGS
ncbi:hypothetical protein [Mucilaginibacter sp. L196]|uniref:hypothetical protein n=1 Tax=Mucilaginibacter sp. L196 TaxID=1641870 RepID=UPI00131E4A0D|nr:hypothetical protein [Mucilaginibacter sp. L196]